MVSKDRVELFTSYTHAGSCCFRQQAENKNPPHPPQEKFAFRARKKVSFVSKKILTRPPTLN
jgi:hypothetical protein